MYAESSAGRMPSPLGLISPDLGFTLFLGELSKRSMLFVTSLTSKAGEWIEKQYSVISIQLSVFSYNEDMEKLRIYQKTLELVAKIYQLIRNNPSLAKDYSLNDQLRRAAISILANIAEGYCRSKKQFQNYLQIASGSANETVALLQVIALVHRINTSVLQEEYKLLGRQINSFSKILTDY